MREKKIAQYLADVLNVGTKQILISVKILKLNRLKRQKMFTSFTISKRKGIFLLGEFEAFFSDNC